MRKKLKWIAIIVTVLFAIALFGLWWNINGIVRSAIETSTGKSLALKTELGKANVQLFSGDVSIGDLKIANAEGFSEPNLLTLGSVSVDTSYSKVFKDPVAIDAITIGKPKLTIEFKGTKSNLKAVADNLTKTQQGQPAPTPSPNPPPSPAPTPDQQKQAIKLIIDSLAVNGAQVEIVSDMLKLRQTIDIPAINLTAIGNADGNRNGEEIGKVASQVIAALTLEAEKSGKLPPELATILNGDVGQLVDQIGGKFKEQIANVQADALKKVAEFQGQALQKVDAVKGQAQQQLNAATQKAQQELQNQLGGLLTGSGSSDDKKDDKKKKK